MVSPCTRSLWPTTANRTSEDKIACESSEALRRRWLPGLHDLGYRMVRCSFLPIAGAVEQDLLVAEPASAD